MFCFATIAVIAIEAASRSSVLLEPVSSPKNRFREAPISNG